MKDILICGCGNIGFRHLQALTSMPDAPPLRLTVIEPAPALHGAIRAALEQHLHRTGGRAELCRELPEAGRRFDLAVIATNAADRRSAFDAIIAGAGAGIIVFEKVLFQRPADLDAVAMMLDACQTAAFVNCTRRAFPGYAGLRAALASDRPVHLSVHGSEFGLASNLIHFLDLAEYLNDAALVGVDLSGLQAGSVAAKRPGCVEVYGTARADLSNGAGVTVACDRGAALSLSITLRTASGAMAIDEARGRLRRTNAPQDGDFATLQVSGLGAVYRGLLRDGGCCLTPYPDAVRQHRLYLGAMAAHLGLAADGTTPVPVS